MGDAKPIRFFRERFIRNMGGDRNDMRVGVGDTVDKAKDHAVKTND